MNWFVLLNLVICFFAAIWYFAAGAVKLGCLQICYVLCNAILLWIGKV